MTDTNPTAMTDAPIADIIGILTGEFYSELLIEAVEEAQRRRDEIIPHLIDLILQATERARAGKNQENIGHQLAIYLLTEFQAKEALPAIVEVLTLAHDGALDVFGEAVSGDLNRIITTLASDQLDLIDELISNRAINVYLRWEMLQYCLLLVRDGRLTREEAVARLCRHLSEMLEADDREFTGSDYEFVSAIIVELSKLAPPEAMDAIKAAFDRNLVDASIVDLDFVERCVAEGDAGFQRNVKQCPTTGINDAFIELNRLGFFFDPQSRCKLTGNIDDRVAQRDGRTGGRSSFAN